MKAPLKAITDSQSVSQAATDYSSLFDHVSSTSWFKALDLSSKQEGDLGHFMHRVSVEVLHYSALIVVMQSKYATE